MNKQLILSNNNKEIVYYNNEIIKNNIKKEGDKILSENNFFKDLDKVMNSEFRTFYNKYFKNYSDVKITLLYMKLYETLQIEYKERYKTEIEKEYLAFIMKELMTDNSTRKQLMESFDRYTKDDKSTVLDLFLLNNTIEYKKNNKQLK